MTVSRLPVTPSPARTLTVTSNAGLCNRLRVLLSGKVVAGATRREFAMLWQPDRVCAATFDQVFENEWNVGDDVEFDERHEIEFSHYAWNEIPDLLRAPQDHLFVRHFGWVYQPTRHAHHAALEPAVRALMLALSPVPTLQARIKSFRETHFRPKMIGVHLRRGDLVRWRPDTAGDLTPTMQTIDAWLDESPDAGILVCTDDGAPHPYTGRAISTQGVMAQMTARYGKRVVCTQARLERNTRAAIEDAVVDLFLLRATDYFVGTFGSSFSELGMFARSVPFVLAGGRTRSYQWQMRWLERLGLAARLEQIGQREFGKSVPYPYLILKYRQRVRQYFRQISLRRKT